MVTQEQKHELLLIARKLSRLSREFERTTQQQTEIIKSMGYRLKHDAGVGFEDEDGFPDWYVEMTDYGQGDITISEIDKLLCELKRME